jgi:hypothetical protein
MFIIIVAGIRDQNIVYEGRKDRVIGEGALGSSEVLVMFNFFISVQVSPLHN